MAEVNTAVKKIIKNDRFYYGWIILAVSAAAVFFSAPGQTYFTSVFIESYVAEFGWSRSALSSLYSLATLISGLLLFLVGKLGDRFGQKKIMLLAAIVLGLSSFWTSQIVMLWMLFIGFFVGRLAGQGSLTLLPSIVLPRWFFKRRAFAFSMMALGGVIGSALIPPLNSILIEQIGWRVTWRVWSVLIGLVIVPLIYVFFFNEPEELGMSIEDEQRKRSRSREPDTAIAESGREDARGKIKFDQVPSWQAKDAVRTFAFWAIMYIQMLLPMIGTGITFHFVSIMTNRGLPAGQTPLLLSIIAAASLLSTLLSGLLLSRISIKQASFLLAGLISISLIILLVTKSFALAVVFALFQGSAAGVQAVWGGLVWPEYFGTRHLGGIRGLASTGMVISSALGPIPLGFAFDQFGKHDSALYLMLILAVTGAGVALIFTRPKPLPAVKNPFLP